MIGFYQNVWIITSYAAKIDNMSVEAFVQLTLDLLDKERDAEIEETQFLNEKLSAKELERKGVCLLKLQLKSRRSGLYGRMVAVFEPNAKPGKSNSKPELPSHNLTPGDIVGVALMKSQATDKPLATGIISQVTSSNISVAFDESVDIFELSDDDLYKLTKLANDVTYRRLKATLNDLAKYRGGPSQRLIDTLFNLAEISAPGGEFPITFMNESLDESQREAVKFALTQREVAIIHGPPGTGKTTTVVELVVQAVRQGLKVLVTAPSNIAVDNLVERLANCKQKIVRLGHPARLLAHLQKYSLDAIVSGSDETSIVKDVKTDVQNVLSKLKKARGHGERHSLKEEMKQLRRETSKREEAATKDILSRADVVLTTLTSATRDGPLKFLKEDHFNLVVIDEASQALEAACWIGLLRAPRCVLAGDHLQLPPVILSKRAAKSGLEVTLMERLLKTLVGEKEKDVMRMLTVQYRMHEDIMTWASQQLYQGKLTAHPSVASHLLRDLTGVVACEETNASLLLIDTTGCDLFELDLPEELSKGNEGEADVVAAHVEELIKCGVKPTDIAVIAPYNLQVELLRVRLCANHPGLEVKSVDGFQGREKEAVVISFVRSNPSGEVGFLAEKRRINVAVTRARRHLAVVCDVETVSHDPFIKSLVDYMTEKGELLTAHQYIQEGKVGSISNRPTRSTKSATEQQVPKGNKKEKFSAQALQTKEEKMKQYQEKLEEFVADASQLIIDFPASLNSHDRMVIHEVAETLGLSHTSTGEGSERIIQVSKVKVERNDTPTASIGDQSSLSEQMVATALDGIQSLGDVFTVKEVHDKDEEPELSSSVQSSSVQSSSVQSSSVQSSSEVTSSKPNKPANLPSDDKQDSASDNSSIPSSHEMKQNKTKAPRKQKSNIQPPKLPTKEHQNTEICKYCQKNIHTDNLVLHVLHCAKRSRGALSTAQDNDTVGGEVRKKETKVKEKKEKPKKSHVQKASDVLSKIDNDDFDGLIASITELDSKCAFQKCKILTNTLGRNCEYCTRRFCLTHLMPEVHGCGDAVKIEARRIISREGVLHRGSGVPDKKPSQARRAQLESKMEKKLGELAGRRSRNV